MLRLVAGELHPSAGRIATTGGIGVMRQFTGAGRVRDLLLAVAPDRIRQSSKTILLVSHDRQLLANTTDRVLAVEHRDVWVHGGGFATFGEARRRRIAELDEKRRRWEDERRRLKVMTHTLRQAAAKNDAVSSAYRAARGRLARFEEAGAWRTSCWPAPR